MQNSTENSKPFKTAQTTLTAVYGIMPIVYHRWWKTSIILRVGARLHAQSVYHVDN